MAGLLTQAPRSELKENGDRVGVAPPVLFGREDDIGLIDGLFDKIVDGGAALIIRGEPGIGKSSLLEVAQHRARARGLRVLRLSGVASEAHLPFGALQQAIGPILKQADTLPPRQHSALQAAFGLSDDATAPDIFLVGLAILTLLTASAARKPILLVADDIQWLDQASHDVLAFVSRRLSSDPIIALMAMRTSGEDQLLHPNIPSHPLPRLDEVSAQRLLDAKAPGLSVDLRLRFLDVAAGNPLALVELPRGDRGVETGDLNWLPLTDRLKRTFFGRVSELPPVTRTLLLVVAENDSRSLRETLDAGAVLLGAPVELDALAPAVSAMLIDIATGEVRFRHPLVRSAVHQAADPLRRQQVHAALAQVIRDQSERSLWHRMQSTIGPDAALARELDEAAGRSQRRGALATAIIALENAARLGGTALSKNERLLRAAGYAADLGQPATVERLLREVDLNQQQPHMRAHFAWIREIGEPFTVNDPMRIPALVSFSADAQSVGASDLALGLLWRAAQRGWWGNASDAVRESVFAAANALGVPATDARLIAIASYIEPLKYGDDVHRELAAHATAGLTDPVAAWILGLAANTIGAFDFGLRFLTEASSAFREQGRLGDLARVLFARGWAEMETGDWTGALRSAEESIRFAEETGATVWIAAATTVKATVAGMRGDPDAAEALALQAERLVHSGATFVSSFLQAARGVTALGAGQPEEAHAQLWRLNTPADPAFNTSLQFFGLADFVEAAVSCGEEAVAAAFVADVERRSSPNPVPWVRTMLCYSRALLASPARAEAFFQEGLGPAAQNWPFLRGRLLLAYGEWLRRQRRMTEARAPLRTARDIFDVLAAMPWSNRARRELRAAGEASRPRAGRMLDMLTPQELQIAELAASGLSNKEIGARLYLSHRTVGYHLYRVFPKLDVTTRSGLRTALNRPSQLASD